ncbi:glycine oxidase ThiO [Rhodococcus sp. IEGM 1379]|uniref:glycine oxidase ThiO n=1 Tax=Rhodococcus sp. IEGM 1379 TaxID=3047086 RepID=UPI0024B816D2|nr:glycine oxidase ThiO [Rhodococcus sp. IEGM 1379]MDI9916162.1 glycine oxidase ThiO [Rhodococcus sp. IEGM 1379]
MSTQTRSVAVVGGGVIGLSIAWHAARDGWAVQLYDPAVGTGASWVAGGMLAPLSEGWPGEETALTIGAASLARWPEFGARLEKFGPSVFTGDTSLTVALDSADAQDLNTIAEWVSAQGHELQVLNRSEVRDLEPMLGRGIRSGLMAVGESAVDNRALLTALQAACIESGVELIEREVHDLAELDTDQIVLTAGISSPKLWPGLPVRPVKGEILRLRARPGVTPAPSRTIRGSVHGRPAYLVPRSDGIVVGATQYESGDDTRVTMAGVRDLINDAEALMPAIGEYELYECAAGLRPMTPDNLPLIGRVSERVVVSTGHGRNGILLTPVTADATLALLNGTSLVEVKGTEPQRFGTGKEIS